MKFIYKSCQGLFIKPKGDKSPCGSRDHYNSFITRGKGRRKGGTKKYLKHCRPKKDVFGGGKKLN